MKRILLLLSVVLLTVLGVHEHWNNPVDKQYSRNLGAGEGIELIQTGASASESDHAETPTAPVAFRDVPANAWYADAVAYCHQQGLMSGISADVFAPAETVSRGMLAAILYRKAGSPTTQISTDFPDVAANT